MPGNCLMSCDRPITSNFGLSGFKSTEFLALPFSEFLLLKVGIYSSYKVSINQSDISTVEPGNSSSEGN